MGSKPFTIRLLYFVTGKHELIAWLLEQARGSLNTKDKESGWTALHRAVFYGRIASAVLLLKVSRDE